MVTAVLMAGYNNKRAVKRYARVVAEHYGERFIEAGYKPLREFSTFENGKQVRKPLIQYTLETLFNSDLIGDIVIVGHQMLLERRLGNFIQQFDKPCRIVNQNTKIPPDVIERFGILSRKVRYNSVVGNLIKGYVASTACKEKKHALFVAADSPFTSGEFIKNFLQLTQKYLNDTAILVPAILIRDAKDKLGRHPLKLLNDSEFQLPDDKDEHGRQGFRLSSVLYANPNFFDLNTGNTAYSLRKCLNPNVQLKLFRITRSLGYPNVYSKYFLHKDLSITEVENITSAHFNGRLKIVPMIGEEATYDYDGTDREFRVIAEMLSSNESSSSNS